MSKPEGNRTPKLQIHFSLGKQNSQLFIINYLINYFMLQWVWN
jgi:hypothetical protein